LKKVIIEGDDVLEFKMNIETFSFYISVKAKTWKNRNLKPEKNSHTNFSC
jgi:hypothetical protein